MIRRISSIYAWASVQPNWVSALTHGGICALAVTAGLVLEFLSYLVEPAAPIPFISHSAAAAIGGYTLREIYDSLKAVGTEDEGQKLGHSYEDLIAAVLVSIALAKLYGGLF